jgi:hypothetical protein
MRSHKNLRKSVKRSRKSVKRSRKSVKRSRKSLRGGSKTPKYPIFETQEQREEGEERARKRVGGTTLTERKNRAVRQGQITRWTQVMENEKLLKNNAAYWAQSSILNPVRFFEQGEIVQKARNDGNTRPIHKILSVHESVQRQSTSNPIIYIKKLSRKEGQGKGPVTGPPPRGFGKGKRNSGVRRETPLTLNKKR